MDFYRCAHFASFAALVTLIYFSLLHYSNGELPWIFFNSDNGFPHFYQDIFLEGGNIREWKFAAVNNFFPDMFLFSLTASLFSLKTTLLLIPFLQLIFYFFLINAIGSLLVEKSQRILFDFMSLLPVFLLSVGSFAHKEIFESALVGWLHFGVFLMGLVGLFLIIQYQQSKKLFHLILLFLICFLSTFSDLLFITQFFLPAVFTLMMLGISSRCEKNSYFLTAAIIFSGTLLGYLIYRSGAFGLMDIKFEHHVIKRLHFADLYHASQKIMLVLREFAKLNPLMAGLFFTYFLSTLFFSKKILREKNKSVQFVLIFLAMSVMSGVISLFFLDNDLMVEGYTGMRHYQAFILYPILLGLPLYFLRLNKLLNPGYFFVLAIMVVIAYEFNLNGSLLFLSHFYPQSIACLDHYIEQFHLQNGLANYWEARPYHLLSHQKITMAAVTQDLEFYDQISTSRDYKNKKFDFLIVSNVGDLSPSYPPGVSSIHFSEKIIKEKFGAPIKVVQCPTFFNDSKENIYILGSVYNSLGRDKNHLFSSTAAQFTLVVNEQRSTENK